MEEIIRVLQELIRFKSVTGNSDEIDRCARFIGDYLDGCGIAWTLLEKNGIPSILVTPEPGRAPLLLMSHMDVVAGPEESFSPRIEGDRLYGRGSVDDKYAVAVSLVLLKERMAALKAAGKGQESLPFGVLITGDEESGGFDGAAYALGKVETEFCIALDGGSPEKIVVKEKGILQLQLVTEGLSAHGARPWLGRSAIDALVDDLVALREFFTGKSEDHWHRTLNVGIIRGGGTVNQVPDRAEAFLDIRYTEADDVDDLLHRMRERVSGRIEVRTREPLFDGGESSHLAMLRRAVPGARLGAEHGGSDARFLGNFGIPGAVWGADGEMSQHSAGEYVLISSVREVFEGLDRFLSLTEKGE